MLTPAEKQYIISVLRILSSLKAKLEDMIKK